MHTYIYVYIRLGSKCNPLLWLCIKKGGLSALTIWCLLLRCTAVLSPPLSAQRPHSRTVVTAETRAQLMCHFRASPPSGGAPLLLPRQRLCATPRPAPTQESDTRAGVAAVSPPARWSMRQFPASGARWGGGGGGVPGEDQLSCSLWYCQGRVMALCSNSRRRANVVWLCFSFPMHYHCSEQERDGEKTAEPPGMWEDDGPAAGGEGLLSPR